MDRHQRVKRFGMCVILWAALLRLLDSGLPAKALALLKHVDIAPFPIYSETGRDVRFSASRAVFSDHFRESPPPWFPEEQAEPTLPVFSPTEAEEIAMYYGCTLRPELELLLTEPLEWDLMDQQPAVLILHTHTTESYTPKGEPYVEVSDYRTLDEGYNMLSIGDRVAEILEENGIRVIHDRTVHDYPSYNGSYVHARKTLGEILAENPSIRLVLDLHRDASGTPGNQMRTEVWIDGQPSAQLMLVGGTGSGGQTHEDWERNLSLGLKLHVLLERQNPGIMRPLSLRAQRFNQDLCPGALLVEVGAAGNTQQEALRAAERLARAIVLLSRGAAAE